MIIWQKIISACFNLVKTCKVLLFKSCTKFSVHVFQTNNKMLTIKALATCFSKAACVSKEKDIEEQCFAFIKNMFLISSGFLNYKFSALCKIITNMQTSADLVFWCKSTRLLISSFPFSFGFPNHSCMLIVEFPIWFCKLFLQEK